jgi:circadian clock protein KaiC
MPPPVGSVSPKTILKKSPTFIPGLDEVLEGGLPTNRTTMISGGPGSGKTLFGMEFLYRGALAGEPGIFVSFEEPLDQLRENAATLGWDLAALERENKLFIMDGRMSAESVVSGDFSLKGLLSIVAGKAKEMGAKRVFVNAPVVVIRYFDKTQQVRIEMHALVAWLQGLSLTAVMTTVPHRDSTYLEDFFDSMADCVIRMEARVQNQVTVRRLRVIKLRGSGFGRNEYPYVITDSGLRVAPISGVQLKHKRLGEQISTGLARFDPLLAGGYRRGCCILAAGQPGTGKTLLATTFVEAACNRGEKVLFVSYEESEEALIGNMQSAGVELQPHLEADRLRFITSMPEAMGAEEHLIRLTDELESYAPAHVVVDAISACERMGGRAAAFDYMVRVLSACKHRGITIMLVNQTFGVASSMEISGHGISSMVDTLIYLSYADGAGETNRLLQILKSRGSEHSNQKHEYVITAGGIQLKDAYMGEGEVLTGAARQLQEGRDKAEYQRLDFEVQAKELEVKRLKLAQELAARGVIKRADLRGKHGAVAPAPTVEPSPNGPDVEA